ncbi:claudin-4-like [Chanos chanos]|uniref:Claudin-4-like n=1 Tax=Chanos chanos TaxID=29144 RepID=A0A6J2VYF3_CHACN|nr:claudin-4-like [Chanos chanos]
MASMNLQMLASALALLGWVGTILTCILPMWRVTAFVGTSIVTSQTTWEGIWMTCMAQSTGQVQCRPYYSMLALSADLKAARALSVLAILTGAIGLILAFVGGKCTRFLDDRGERAKAKVAIAAGAVIILAGFFCIIPVCWTANMVVKNFYNPQMVDSQRREIGASIYIGWGSSLLLFLAGGMFCSSSCPPKDEDDGSPSVKYHVVRSTAAGSSMAGSHRVRESSVRPSQNGPASVRTQESEDLKKDRPPSAGSRKSKAPSTKSQLSIKTESVTESEHSEGASTKSQLMRMDSNKSLNASEASDTASANATKTYI